MSYIKSGAGARERQLGTISKTGEGQEGLTQFNRIG